VREDMPSVHDYLMKQNRERIMRTIVEGVTEWKETYENFYKFKGNHKKTLEQKEIGNEKKKIYDNVYQYWKKIGKAVYKDDFPEKL
jgi:hypothetical protein